MVVYPGWCREECVYPGCGTGQGTPPPYTASLSCPGYTAWSTPLMTDAADPGNVAAVPGKILLGSEVFLGLGSLVFSVFPVQSGHASSRVLLRYYARAKGRIRWCLDRFRYFRPAGAQGRECCGGSPIPGYSSCRTRITPRITTFYHFRHFAQNTRAGPLGIPLCVSS